METTRYLLFHLAEAIVSYAFHTASASSRRAAKAERLQIGNAAFHAVAFGYFAAAIDDCS